MYFFSDYLFDGSNISVTEACLSIVSFIERFNLTEVAKKSLLNLINIIIPFKNKLPKTVNKIYKKVSSTQPKYNQEFYCNTCMSRLDENNFCTPCQFSCIKKSSSFSFINIRNGLQKLFYDYHENINAYK